MPNFSVLEARAAGLVEDPQVGRLSSPRVTGEAEVEAPLDGDLELLPRERFAFFGDVHGGDDALAIFPLGYHCHTHIGVYKGDGYRIFKPTVVLHAPTALMEMQAAVASRAQSSSLAHVPVLSTFSA